MAISTQDFISGVDTTDLTQIPPETINNLVNLATPAAIIGLVINTIDVAGNAVVPDAATVIKWQNYIWRRQTASAVITYVWNPLGMNNGAGPGFEYWQPITAVAIGANSITNAMLQANCVTSDKIASCAWASIIGAPAFIQPTDVITNGTFAGSPYNDLVLGASSVGPIQLANFPYDIDDAQRAVTNSSIQNLSIKADGNVANAVGKIALPATKNYILKAEDVQPPNQLRWVAEFFSDLSVNVGAGLNNQVPQWNTALVPPALNWWTPPVLKIYSATDPANTLPANDTVITFAHGLAAVPSFFKVVIVCLTTYADYAVNDEIDLSSFTGSNSGVTNPCFSVAADATDIKCLINSASVATHFYIADKLGGSNVDINAQRGKFAFRVHAMI